MAFREFDDDRLSDELNADRGLTLPPSSAVFCE
jgi:hypothetical protein